MRAFGMSDISSLRTCRREEHVCGAAYMDSCCMGLAVTFGLFFFEETSREALTKSTFPVSYCMYSWCGVLSCCFSTSISVIVNMAADCIEIYSSRSTGIWSSCVTFVILLTTMKWVRVSMRPTYILYVLLAVIDVDRLLFGSVLSSGA
jgi:hypothetical protein